VHRAVPVGIEFGTVGVLDRHGTMHEVTTFRRDIRTDGRHAVVEFGASLDDDLARRDFTINAIAWEPLRRRLHDPFDGRGDLARGIVRAVGDPAARMREDRLRALRAIRFAARFGFELDPATWDAVRDSAPHLGRLSPERVKQEIEKTVEQAARPSLAFRRWRDAGAFAAVVPPLATVSDRTLAAVDALPCPGLRGRPQRRSLRLAALFGELPPREVEQALRALRFANQELAWVGALVDRLQRHAEPLRSDLERAAVSGGTLPPDGTLRRLAAGVGRLRVSSFVRLAAARWQVERADGDGSGSFVPPAPVVRALHRRLLRIAFGEPIELADLAVDGDDLRALNYSTS
jgi:tRNA nucleotidyltransferase (CCA-adding enzyme)